MIGFTQPGMMAGMLLAAIILAPATTVRADPSAERGPNAKIEELVVTSRRREEPLARQQGNLASLDAGSIAAIGHQHIHELITRVPGVWLARGETFFSGNDVDSAPRWLGSAEVLFEPGNNAAFVLQWVSMGDYYLDAENRLRYPGHQLMNLRTRIDLSRRLSVTARFNNIFDEDIANRADYAFGQYRFFPVGAASCL
ncbi:MAG: TonB-dependent receptor [Gammaproteobacteria bacterium]|nr:TonB-dependent receptor [Gammaproteobacteria bacterium]MDH3481033.1 TonB-dependent receptor [Gammaproteobacteria bacterium]